ncbi:ABC transporter substrate-binding protein [Pusillimonas noertemannii]|uniref:Iron(III) transport system substrate-binding protein n=1 Tax=Pusillimonas noertemannii TaxID=305977 RepID=A0A2U1CIG3_9BURK|nr:extracellular solute-binding protein [Pusillimonas noertemannii]NYT70774.1 extracellular solute-binding protein [Pusillimonas noertemannii]PVY60731.1 iron(III) transport system substrate-binding protein [Pusillimonas noertemannii]TFL08734.1 extracellular solute-binding protein [Pusillimonas noertemannii]
MRIMQHWAAALGLALASAATAQTPASLEQLAVYNGPDREQILIEGARKEGSLTFYTSFAQKDLPPIVSAFEEKYGIKINVWRAGSDKVVQRTLTEASGGRHEVDAIHVGAPELEALHLEKILQPVDTPATKKLIRGIAPAHREWAPTRLAAFVQAYNTDQISKEQLPKSWHELAKPEWKGKLGVEFTDDEWFYTLMQELGEEEGLALFRKIVSENGLSVRKGHSLLANLVVSGEVPMGLTVYSYMAQTLKEKGAPIDWIAIEPVIARANGIAVAKRAPHPHAALLFYDFLLSAQAQKLLAAMHYLPVHADEPSPMKGISLRVSTPLMIPAEAQKWQALYRDVISGTPGN